MDRNEENACLIISNGIQNVCRICAQMFTCMKTIYDFTTCSIQPLIKIIDMLHFLQIPIDDKCPYLICTICEADLFNAYNLKLKSEYSRYIFHEYIQQENTLPLLNNIMIENPSITMTDPNNMLKNKEIMINFNNFCITTPEENFETTTDIFNTLYEAKQKLSKIQSKSNTCKRCLKTFITPDKYQQHKKTHDDIVCFICKRVMKRKSYLKQHMRVHKQPECNYTCNICQMNFNHLNHLIEHHERHLVICITCNYCRKSFMNIIEVLYHKCVHRLKTTERK